VSSQTTEQSLTDSFADGFADSAAKQASPFHQPVFDRKGRRVPGLWLHDAVFYGRVYLRLPNGKLRDRRVRLTSTKLIEARRELAALRSNPPTDLFASRTPSPCSPSRPEVENPIDGLPLSSTASSTITLSDFAPHYLSRASLTKRASTAATERVHLGHLVRDPLGKVLIQSLRKAEVLQFRDRKLREGWSPRTANLALTVLRNVLQCARDEGLSVPDPLTGIRPLRHVPKRRTLYSTEEIEHLAKVAETVCPSSGRVLANFLRVCAYSGMRCSEAMRLRWSDVQRANRQLIVGSDGMTKNHESRAVDFNPRLEEVLRNMRSQVPNDTEFLFSPPRKVDQPYKTLRQTLQTARCVAQMQGFGFHDCRHHFVSVSVMSGIDYLTIARWVGHKDGGVLIGRVYGHLSAEHLQKSAMRLTFKSHTTD